MVRPKGLHISRPAALFAFNKVAKSSALIEREVALELLGSRHVHDIPTMQKMRPAFKAHTGVPEICLIQGRKHVFHIHHGPFLEIKQGCSTQHM